VSTNSFDALFAQQQQPAAAPPPAVVSAPPSGGNSFDQLFTAAPAAPALTAAPKAAGAGNSFDKLFGAPKTSRPQNEQPEETSGWLSKSWDWLNKPLLDLHRQGAGGFESGAEDVLSGLTSPLSIALTVGTLGSGTALEALGLTARELPVAVQGVKALVEGGFTLQQAHAVLQESPRVLDALKEGDYETAKRLAVHVVANGALAALGASKVLPEVGELAERTGLRTPNGELAKVREELGTYQLDVEKAGHGAVKLEQAARAALPKGGAPNDVLLGAISRFAESGGDTELLAQRKAALEASSAVKDNYSAKDRQKLLTKYDLAQNLTPEQENFARNIRESFDQDLERAYQKGVIRTAVENYISHVWEDDPTNVAANRVKYQAASRQFDTNVSAARARTLDTMFDGEVLGKKVAVDDPVALIANYRLGIGKAIAARDFMERLQDKDLRAPDGRAIVAASGRGETIGENENPATLINPKAARSMRIAQSVSDGMEQTGELAKHLDSGAVRQLGMRDVRLPEDIQEQLQKNPLELKENIESGQIKQAPDGTLFGPRPVYGWETGDYRAIDHPAFRDWNFATNAPDGSPIFVKSDLRVHPDAAEFLQRAVGADRSPIRDLKIGDVPVGRKFLKISSEGKHLLLSLSPFHLTQEGLRAVMTGINPFGKLDFDLDNDAALQYGVTHGLTLGGGGKSLESFTEGVSSHSAIINRIPGIRSIQGQMQNFLFDKYIPGLKARAYKSLFERYLRTYSDISTTEAAQLAAAHSNELFGGLNYVQMGRSVATQDFLRATTLAPDWLESEVRSLYRAVDPKRGAIMRQDIARISAIMFGAARVLNLLTTGQAHPESPFGVVLPGRKGEDDKILTLRTLPTDLLHAVTDPRAFIAGRVNPLTVRPAMEFLSGRDTLGRKVTPGQEAGDFLSSFVPIPSKALAGKFTGDISNPETVAKVLGASTYTYRTSAEKLAQELASDRMPTGPVTDAELGAHQRNIRLEDALRNGTITPGQVRQQLPRAAAQAIIDGASLSPLQSRFRRLPLADKLQVFDLALPREKEEIQSEMKAARQAYIKTHPPSQRASDPNWRRLQSIFGN
jgi:hypothetical protein